MNERHIESPQGPRKSIAFQSNIKGQINGQIYNSLLFLFVSWITMRILMWTLCTGSYQCDQRMSSGILHPFSLYNHLTYLLSTYWLYFLIQLSWPDNPEWCAEEYELTVTVEFSEEPTTCRNLQLVSHLPKLVKKDQQYNQH